MLETVHVGLGVIGQRLCATGLAAGVYRPVAAVDPAPALVGRDLGDLIGAGALGVPIRASLAEALTGAALPPRLALHATRSTVAAVRDELIALVEAGCDVVSTCEELAAPRLRASAPPTRSTRPRGGPAAGSSAPASIPASRWTCCRLSLVQAATEVRSITIRRVQDPLKRRQAFQHKVGVGRSNAECEADMAAGVFGHVGLRESAAALAAGLGWELGRVRESLSLVLEPDGQTSAGVRQTLSARSSDGRLIRLIFHAIAGTRRESDQVLIDGDPPLRMQLPRRTGRRPGDRQPGAFGCAADRAGRAGAAGRGTSPLGVA